VHESIGERVAALILDTATLQLGIGAVPDVVLGALRRRTGLAVWSEIFSDRVVELERAGALDPGRPVTASFAFGSAELYGWIDRNPRVRLLRTEKANDPGVIARQGGMVSVNGALHSPGGRAIIALPSWHPKADASTVVPRLAGLSHRSSTASSLACRAPQLSGATTRAPRPLTSSTTSRTLLLVTSSAILLAAWASACKGKAWSLGGAGLSA
jgi:acyl-CoA hydrolase